MAGLSAAEAARATLPEANVTLVCGEPVLPYYRTSLGPILAGDGRRDALLLHPESWYAQQRIQVLRETIASRVDLDSRLVELCSGERLPFGKLVIATGASPVRPPVAGVNRNGVLAFCTLADTDRILVEARAGAQCLIMGGGLLGLETAGALIKRGCRVTVVEAFRWLLPKQLNEPAARIVEAHMRALGMDLRLGVRVAEVTGGNRVSGARLTTGDAIPADFVVLAAGVLPNIALVKAAGLATHIGILVNDVMRTSHPDVYAAGDVAEHRSIVYGLWGPARFMGKAAGLNASGARSEFGGIPPTAALKVLGINALSMGEFMPRLSTDLVLEHAEDGRYCSFVARDNTLVGAILIGYPKLGGPVRKAIEGKLSLESLLQKNPTAKDIMDHFGASIP
jgi:nitrite reductase (NADH) large subunit